MSSESQPNAQDANELETAIDQAIATCDGDMRATIRTLIVANNYLESEVGELMKAVSPRLCKWKISHLFRLGANYAASNLFRGAAPSSRRTTVWRPGEAVECFNPNAAIVRAETLSRQPGNVGAVAFSRTGDPATGDFSDAKVLRKFGEVPEDLSVQ